MPADGLLGELTPDSLRNDPATAWFALGYDLYSFEDGESYRALLAAQGSFDRMEILAFIGTWCPDCQEHVPALARILDAIRFPRERLRLYGLDRAKTFAGGAELIAKHSIRRLPTFVVLKDGQEAGRITETPETTLIADLARIF
jgi:thiol-disulfide isomerase/thioredoxin